MTLGLITVALSTTIGAPLERVWISLTDPGERVLWDRRVLGEVSLHDTSSRDSRDAHHRPGTDTNAGRHAALKSEPRRWRFRLGGVPLVLREEIVEAERGARIASHVSIGTLGFEQTLTLHREDDETGPRTRLGMRIAARNSVPVIGEIVQRLDVQKLVIEYADATLRQVQKHCEADA